MGKLYPSKVIQIGVFFLLSASILFETDVYQQKRIQKREMDTVDAFLEQQTLTYSEDAADYVNTKVVNYIAVLEIPKIHLKKGLFAIGDSRNNVDQNIQILKESHFPNEPNGNLILAGHSGIGPSAYFNHLKDLAINDLIYFYYQGVKYTYHLSLSYEMEKTGYFTVPSEPNTLILITCKMDTQKQLVFVASLYKQENI